MPGRVREPGVSANAVDTSTLGGAPYQEVDLHGCEVELHDCVVPPQRDVQVVPGQCQACRTRKGGRKRQDTSQAIRDGADVARPGPGECGQHIRHEVQGSDCVIQKVCNVQRPGAPDDKRLLDNAAAPPPGTRRDIPGDPVPAIVATSVDVRLMALMAWL